MNGFSPAQLDAVIKIQCIMREHFDGGVLCVCAIADGEDNQDCIEALFHGGAAVSIGLAEIALQEALGAVCDVPLKEL